MISRARPKVNNEFYDGLGPRWTEDRSHAIALLHAEMPVKLGYVRGLLSPGSTPQRIIDIGCGAGFVTNPLARDGHRVLGVDRSASSLAIASRAAARAGFHAEFSCQDAAALDEPSNSFDMALLLDVLEHVDDLAAVLREAVRVVRPDGLIVVHTFNRTPLAYLVAVLGPRLLTKTCPARLHVYRAFVRPDELRALLAAAGAPVAAIAGVQPRILSRAFLATLRHREVHPDFAFAVRGAPLAGYVGWARKLPGR